MPIYEYRCNNCKQVFEVIQKFSDEPLTTHAACGGEVKRLLSAPSLQFKGTGFYITDYPKSGGGGGGEKKSDSKSEGSKTESAAPAKTETKTESKPAAPAASTKSE